MIQVKRKAQEESMSTKEVINRALRAGIDAVGETKLSTYSCRSFSLGVPREVDLNHAIDVFDALQDQEIARKLQLKK